jgi:hypothetical protein
MGITMSTVKDRRTLTTANLSIATAAIALALVVAAGCTSPGTFGDNTGGGLGSGSGGGGGNNPPPTSTPPPSTGTPIPANAMLVASDKKPAVPLSFTAKQSGRVYLLDATDKKLLMNTAILQDQTIATEPANNRVVLGGRELQKFTFDPEHFYELYFTPQ